MKLFQKQFIGYKLQWITADFIFISDMLANSLFGSKYYELFTWWGFNGEVVNTVVSLLEIIRIVILVKQNHNKE